MDHDNERDLLARAQAGDETAFALLYHELTGVVERFTRRLVGRNEGVQDVVQNAFLSLYLNLSKIRQADSLRPYLFRIVRNLCYDELRARGRFDTKPVTTESPEQDEDVPDLLQALPDEVAHWAGIYLKVSEAIDVLPELQRQAMLLWFCEGLKYREVAEAMNTDIGTVKSRIHTARRNVRKALGPRVLEELGVSDENERAGKPA